MKHEQAKFAFFYMLSLVALVFMSLGLGMIVFQIINKFIPDTFGFYQGRYTEEAIQFGIAALIIASPIYYFLMRQIKKSLFSGELDKDAGVRRWLTYFIMFASAVVFIIWLIITLTSFLDGELTAKFILKILTVLLISGGVFSFYFYDIKREEFGDKEKKVYCAYFFVSLFLILSALTGAFFTIDSPAEMRAKRVDSQILNEFNMIDNGIDFFYRENGRIPDNLTELIDKVDHLNQKNITHPQSKEIYELKKTGDNTFELCAEFMSSNKDEDSRYGYRQEHDKGYQCLKYNLEKGDGPVPLRD